MSNWRDRYCNFFKESSALAMSVHPSIRMLFHLFKCVNAIHIHQNKLIHKYFPMTSVNFSRLIIFFIPIDNPVVAGSPKSFLATIKTNYCHTHNGLCTFQRLVRILSHWNTSTMLSRINQIQKKLYNYHLKRWIPHL